MAALAIALGYYLGARLGFSLTLSPVPVSTLWPPNAILMAGLLLTPPRSWPPMLAAVFAAHLAVQFQSGVPAGMVLCWFVSNCTEALLGASLLLRFGRGRSVFDTVRGTAVFLVRRDRGHGLLVVPRRRRSWRSTDGGTRATGRSGARGLLERAGGHHARPGHPDHRRAPARPPPVARAGSPRQPGSGCARRDLLGRLPCTGRALAPCRRCSMRRFRCWSLPRSGSARSARALRFLSCALVAIWGAGLGQGPFVSQLTAGERAGDPVVPDRRLDSGDAAGGGH